MSELGNAKAEIAAAIKKISSGEFEIGLDLTDSLLLKYPEHRADIFRERSHALLTIGKHDDALKDRQSILDSDAATIADYYFAGEYALQAGHFNLSRNMFDQTIEKSVSSGQTYYLQASRLLAALASYQLHDDYRCIDYLNLVDDEVEVLWLNGFDRVSKQLVLSAINSEKGAE